VAIDAIYKEGQGDGHRRTPKKDIFFKVPPWEILPALKIGRS
jgi:hypothetical protein